MTPICGLEIFALILFFILSSVTFSSIFRVWFIELMVLYCLQVATLVFFGNEIVDFVPSAGIYLLFFIMLVNLVTIPSLPVPSIFIMSVVIKSGAASLFFGTFL